MRNIIGLTHQKLGHLGCFVNDAARKSPECYNTMKLKIFSGYPRLCLYVREKFQSMKSSDMIMAMKIKICPGEICRSICICL